MFNNSIINKNYVLSNNTLTFTNNIKNKIKNINKIVSNINVLYKQIYLIGGDNKNISINDSDNSTNITIPIKKYDKIKKFIKAAKKTIIYYKNIATTYYNSYTSIFYNYMILLELLKQQKNNLTEKQSQYEKLSKNYSNGIDKISMLETMITNIEKLVSKTINLDLDVKNNINDKNLNIQATAIFNTDNNSQNMKNIIDKSLLLGGKNSNTMLGGMNYIQFEENINNELNILNNLAVDLENDNNFIETKINSLHDKVKNLMGETENLMNIRLSIEWLVNQLEKKDNLSKINKEINEPNNIIIESQVDYQELYDKLKETIDDIKMKHKSPKIAEYLRELEGMASYFENFINSSKETLNNMPTEKKNEMLDTLKKFHNISDGFLTGGNNINGGGQLINNYNCINNNITRNIFELFSNFNHSDSNVIFILEKNRELNIININDLNLNLDLDVNNLNYNNIKNLNIYQDKLYQIYSISNNLNEIIKYCYELYDNNYNNLNEKWDIFFDNLNTDFYIKIKNFDILNIYNVNNINIDNIQPLLIKATHLLNNIDNIFNKTDENLTKKFIIVFENDYINNIEYIDKIINKLNQTLIFYFHLCLLLFYLFLSKILDSGNIELINTDMLNNLNDEIRNLTKSKLLSYGIENYFSNVYKNILVNDLTGGDSINNTFLKLFETIIQIKKNPNYNKNQNNFFKINTDLQNIFFKNYCISYNKYLYKSVENVSVFFNNICKNINQNFINDNKNIITQIEKLYLIINNKLNINDKNTINNNITNNNFDNNYSNIDEFINLLLNNKEENAELYIKDNINTDTDTNSKIENIIRPRIDLYKKQLLSVLYNLKPFYYQLIALRNLLQKIEPENNITKTTYSIAQLYNTLELNINNGINSYINVNPMIFFTIEYPPEKYENLDCKFSFSYNNIKELVEYNPPNDLSKCNELLDKNNLKQILINTNQAFLKSTKNNSTEDLMLDPIIGLDKIIESCQNKNIPNNKVLNIMFALGASGSGKTVRYFGKENASNPKDRNGIIKEIIKKSINNNSNIRISICYFICYGRKNDIIDIYNNDFNEYLILSNINNLNKKLNDKNITENEINFNNDDFYVFKNKNITTQITNDNYNYTDFYTNLVSKKLIKIQFDVIKNYIINGENLNEFAINNLNSTEEYSFREIIELKTNEDKQLNIWYNITDLNNIEEIFENLTNTQKYIHTILPTNNNMESSRGHTCLLLRIENIDDNNNISNTKYFPLFDMAGTENIVSLNEFFNNEEVNINKMNKLINTVSNLSINNVIKDNNGAKEFSSLDELLKNDIVNKYIKETKKNNMTGGKKNDYIINDNFENIINNSSNINLIDKIIGESYYINHTIAMLIWVIKCIGCSINSTKTNMEDNFNLIESNVFNQMSDYIFLYKNINNTNEILIPNSNENKYQIISNNDINSRIRVLYDKLDYNYLINSNNIWIQIIFSFLYWNEENPITFNEIISNCLNNLNDSNNSNDLTMNIKTDTNITKYLKEQFIVSDIPLLSKIEKYEIFNNNEFNKINPNYYDFYNSFPNDFNLNFNFNFIDDIKSRINNICNILNINNNNILFTLKLKTDNKFLIDNKEINNINNNNNDIFNKNSTILNYLKDKNNLKDNLNHIILYIIYNTEYNTKSNKTEPYINLLFSKINEYKTLTQKTEKEEKKNEIKDILIKIFKQYDINIELENIILNTSKDTFYTKNDKDKNWFIQNILNPLIKENENNIIIKIEEIQNNIKNNINNNITKEKINELINYENIDLLKIYNILNKTLNSTLEFLYKNDNIYLCYTNSNDNIIETIESIKTLEEIIEDYKKLFKCYNEGYEYKIDSDDKTYIQNQINRVRDNRVSATKMVLMHVVTGQEYKYPLVVDTINLNNTLYESTQIKL